MCEHFLIGIKALIYKFVFMCNFSFFRVHLR